MKIKILVLFSLIAGLVKAQSPLQVLISTKHTSLVLTVGKNKRLYQSYLGKRLLTQQDLHYLTDMRHEVYVPGGMEDLHQPALQVVHADGNQSLVLEYQGRSSKKIDGDETETLITLKDPKYPVEVELHYAAFYQENVIKTWTTIRNKENAPLKLSNYASAMLNFDGNQYWLTQFHGDWASEMRMEESALTSGIKIIDSKLGTRPDVYEAPLFMLALNKPASETEGEVIAGTLAWTGNFQFQFEIDEHNALRVISGINPYASAYALPAGKSFTTPAFIFTYSNEGKGQVSRNLHRWAANYGIIDGTKPRYTLLNNWESTFFNFNEAKITGLFDGAKTLGLDLFLLDDGWFANKYPRDNDKQGLGDWEENKAKLPNGIGYLVKQAEAKGIKFGIWIEPEMVNPKSELYEKHPDWILKLPMRNEDYQRSQLVLDLTNPQVQDFVYATIDNMLTKNPGIAYIKWDCNRTMTNTYSPYLKENQCNLYVDYTLGFYKTLDRIRAKYPHLFMMLCSGGGGRTDYGALKYFDEFWPSDNTDPMERIYIQWGYSMFFPSFSVSDHITSWNKQASLKFRTDVAMMGRLGYDIDIKKMTSAEIQFSKQAVINYKRLSDVIWHGDLYRLISPYDEKRAVLMYVDSTKTKAVLFSYVLNLRFHQTFNSVKLAGLDPKQSYRVVETNLAPDAKSGLKENGIVYSGDYLMTVGLQLSPGYALPQSSAVIEITKQ